MHLALVDMEIGIQRIRQSRSCQIDIPIRRNESGGLIQSAGENHRCRGIRREVTTGITRSRRVDIRRDDIIEVVAPRPFFVSILRGRIIEFLRKRNLLRYADTETEGSILRRLAAPCAVLILADRTHVCQVELTRLQEQVMIRHLAADQIVVHDQLRMLHLDLIDQLRINRITGDDDLEVISIKAGTPEEIHLTCTLIEHRQVVGDSTLRSGLQLDVIQHDTMAQVIRSLEGNLIILTYLRQRDLHTLPRRSRTSVLA